MARYSLYIHTNNINGKRYIGITSQYPAYLRWKNGLGYKKSPRFFNAIVKYGWCNFNHVIVFDNLSKKEAEQKEQEYIKKYNTTDENFGYNLQKGGGITQLSELTKYKLKIANTGKKHTEETKRKMSLAQKGKQKCLGYKHTEETKNKHRKLWLGVKNPRAKGIDQYDLDGNFIRHYDYMNEIKKYIDIPSTCHISDCCRGKRNKCYGYIWKYSE